jgi:hypothetical protein
VALFSGADPGPNTATSPLRRLSNVEYKNTVVDLFGPDAPVPTLPEELTGTSGFTENGPIGRVEAQHYLEAAEALASHAARDLSSLLPCEPTPDAAACASSFIKAFGLKAYRRPLLDGEVDSLERVYTWATDQQYEFADALRVVIATMLQTSSFLYLPEFGNEQQRHARGLIPLNGYEVASRLSYLFWRTMPDETLLREAAAGGLTDAEAIEAHAKRLLNDPRAQETIGSFHSQWLGLQQLGSVFRDPKQYPELTPGLLASMQAETDRFVSSVVLEGDGRLETLLTAPYSFVDAPLAELYGVAPPATAFDRVTFPAGTRTGLLTQASVLTMTSTPVEASPIRRGKLIIEKFLCQHLSPPPPDVDTTPPAADPSLSVRSRFAEHSQNPACRGCHERIDPVGFGFSNYDAIGRHHYNEAGAAVDASGSFIKTSDLDGPFSGIEQLSAKLAGSTEVRQCVTVQWFRYAFRRLESAPDTHSLRTAYEGFSATNFNIRELLMALTRTEAFRYRVAMPGEQSP